MSKRDLKKIWEKLEPGYYENGNFGQKMWQFLKLRAIKKVLPKKIKSLLDVGCADGYFLNRIANFLPGSKIYGVDVSPKLIRAAKQKYPRIKFSVADVHELPFKDDQFDLVLCAETLEHVLEPQKVISEIQRVTKPGGEIIIELDSDSLLFKVVFGIWVRFFKGRVWQGAHLHRLQTSKLESLFERVGLKAETKIISHWGMAVTFLLRKTK